MRRRSLDTPQPERRFNGLHSDIRLTDSNATPVVVKRERSKNNSLEGKRKINSNFYLPEKMTLQTPP